MYQNNSIFRYNLSRDIKKNINLFKLPVESLYDDSFVSKIEIREYITNYIV